MMLSQAFDRDRSFRFSHGEGDGNLEFHSIILIEQ